MNPNPSVHARQRSALTLLEVLAVAAVLALAIGLAARPLSRSTGAGPSFEVCQDWEWRIRDEARRRGALEIQLQTPAASNPLAAPPGLTLLDLDLKPMSVLRLDSAGRCRDHYASPDASAGVRWLVDGLSGNLARDPVAR